MLILLGFAILAGAGTALSPCALPVLPALLSAGGAGGRRRPLGVVLGLSVTFTVTIVGLASVVDGVGLGEDPLRDISIVVLLAFGVALLFPDVAARLEAPLSRFSRFGVRIIGRNDGDGFGSGLIVGAALGFIYTPCASPILAAVISASAATDKKILPAIAYAAGSAAVLLALALGGRRVFERVRKAGRGPALGRALGVVMILTGVAILTHLDVSFDQLIAEKIPNVNLTASLECSKAVTGRLHELTGHDTKFIPANGNADCEGAHTSMIHAAAHDASQATLLADAQTLPDLGTAPEFSETEDWFNTGKIGQQGPPLTLPALRGHVVLVDFWTYTCINCIRTLPYLKAWNAAYAKDGLTIVGVETPEFQFEKDAANVQNAIGQFGLRYPVVQDNNMGTWNAYGNEYWPADYLIDAKGQVRYATFGEGDYDKTETAIRALLAEAGAQVGGKSHPTDVVVPSEVATPESYTGTARAQGFVKGPFDGTHDYGPPPAHGLALNDLAYSGTWKIGAQPAEAVSDAGLSLHFKAKNAYLVLSSQNERPMHVRVMLDGRPISAADSGADVHDGIVTVRRQRLYWLVALRGDQSHELELQFENGLTAYDFTFG
ncbi:MAG TPA: cytochrome c biogenesis protein CcdA [Solirubrobacteraceae bacterium]|jgi:cytochrome c biogenesis protein CcdA/thiol-disulfide isomerase/thioredoxin|nr:cytochrome c biogenesis protein CcdA [Solirubrobacteraceae bacterium]